MIYVRVVVEGSPVFLVAGLEDIDSYGDATAENLHRSIKNTVVDRLKLSPDKYKNGIISATSDGASVNTGR